MRPGIYARYSSSNQRAASIEDQLRDDLALCKRLGMGEPVIYTDSEISGERRDRPGYVRLLRDAQARVFDVLIIWDLKRLSRADDLPQVLSRLRFWGVRVITCDGYDSEQEGSDIRGWIDGMIGNKYLRDLAKATHRGLTGRAMEGASAGGLPYGYIVTSTGQRAIRPDQATIVCRIYDEYIAGRSARTIAAALNAEGVPAPRGATWAASAIRPDHKRGIGILANPIYKGEQIWNRSHFVKHPETGLRIRHERPREEWIIRQHPELAIIDRPTWDAALVRAKGNSIILPPRRGRPTSHLLSGILRCGDCDGPIIAIDRYRYGCARAKESGICRSRLRFSRSDAEHALVAGITRELLSDDAFREFQRAAQAGLKRNAPNIEHLERALAKAKNEHRNVMAAIKAGILTASTKAELETCEAAIISAEQALAQAQTSNPARILPAARAVWERMAKDLVNHVRDTPTARTALRGLIGSEIPVRTNENGDPVAVVADSCLHISNVVAGAGFEPATFGL